MGYLEGISFGGMWLGAASGLCIGLGYTAVAFLFTLFVYAVLSILSRMEERCFGKI